MKNIFIFTFIFTLFPFMNTDARQNQLFDPADKGLFLLQETEYGSVWLDALMRVDYHESVYAPPLRGSEYYLTFSTITIFKDSGNYCNTGYTLLVSPKGKKVKLKLRQEGNSYFLRDGEPGYHTHPTGRWTEGDPLAQTVFDYYTEHKEDIPIRTTQVDASSFSPLSQLSDGSDHAMYLTAFSEVNNFALNGNGDFCIECEYTDIRKVVDYYGRPRSYSVSRCLLHFIPHESEQRFVMEVKPISAMSYYDGDQMVEHPVEGEWMYYDKLPAFYQKILDYVMECKD